MTAGWHVQRGSEVVGPIDLAQMRDMVAKGEISTDTLVWREGFEEWVPAGRVPALHATHPDTSEPRLDPAPEDSPDVGGRPERWSEPDGRPLIKSDRASRPQLPLADRVLRTGFAVGRWVSILVVAISLVVIVIAGGAYLLAIVPSGGAPRAEAARPELEEFASMCEQGRTRNPPAAESPPSRDRDVKPNSREGERSSMTSSTPPDPCEPYRDEVREILSQLRLEDPKSGAEEVLCLVLARLPEEDRSWFLEGFLEFAEEWREGEGASAGCDGATAANWYIDQSRRSLEIKALEDRRLAIEHAESEEARRQRSGVAASAVGIALGGLLLFLVVPLLIQIERNTRREAQPS